MKNVSRRGKGLVKSVIRNLCYKTKSPIKDEEVQSVVKPSTRELAVVLTHQQFHEILVTTPNKGVREIYYKLAVEHGSSGSKESDKRKFKEWRLEQIPALESMLPYKCKLTCFELILTFAEKIKHVAYN